MGVYDNRLYFFFNHQDIDEVVQMGYSDNDFDTLKKLISFVDEK